MTNYKLAPVEPTPEMAEAAQDAYMPFGDMDIALRMALLAAPDHIPDTGKKVSRAQIREVFMRNGFTIKPGRDDLADYVYAAAHELLQTAPAMQGDPVGKVKTVGGYPDESEHTIEWLCKYKDLKDGDLLYTAPQTAEQPPLQLPDFATNPDDSDEGASLWDFGFKRGWNSCLEAVAKAMQHAEQQPAPTEQTEPVGWQFYQDGKWWNGDDRIKDHKKNTLAAGFRVRDVYAAPQPAPAGQGEPVAYLRKDQLAQVRRMGPMLGEIADSPRVDRVPVYTAPQPATEAALLEAFVAETAAQAEAAELAGALDEMIKAADVASWGGYFPTDAVTRAVEVLAAYRKQGGEA